MSDVMPVIRAYPKCTKCDAPYVLRRALVWNPTRTEMNAASEWIWQRDCKCRGRPPAKIVRVKS